MISESKLVNLVLLTSNETSMLLCYQPKLTVVGCVSLAEAYMAFSPNTDLNVKPMIDYFDAQMDKIKTSGALKEIMARYGLENRPQFSKQTE